MSTFEGKVYYNLKDRVLVDDKQFGKLKEFTAYTTCIDEIKAIGKPVETVPDAAPLKSMRGIRRNVAQGVDITAQYELIFGTDLPEDIATEIAKLNAAKDHLVKANESFDAAKATVEQMFNEHIANLPVTKEPLTERQLAAVGRISFTDTSVARGGYQISKKQLKRVWDIANPYWQGLEPSVRGDMTVRAHSSTYYVRVRNKEVDIGCQTIDRFELEWIADQLDWA